VLKKGNKNAEKLSFLAEEIHMRSTVRTLLLSCAFFGSIAASAQSTAHFNFPYSFVANGQLLPAGHYELMNDGYFVRLVNENDPQKSIKQVLGPSDPGKSYFNLKFDMCNGTHYLRTIQVGPQITRNLDSTQAHGQVVCATPAM
jgi:hypothetical protein